MHLFSQKRIYDVEKKEVVSQPSQNVIVVELQVRSILCILGLITIALCAIFMVGFLAMTCIWTTCWTPNTQTDSATSMPVKNETLLISLPNKSQIPKKPEVSRNLLNITCKSLVGQFDGVFHNKRRPTKKQQVQLELKLKIPRDNNFFATYKWNPALALTGDTYLNYNYDGDWRGWDRIYDTTLRQINSEQHLEIRFNTDDITSNWIIFYQPAFDNQFHLFNTDGQCTNQLAPLPTDDQHLNNNQPDPKLYSACWCCGDVYNPSPELNCPKLPF